MGFVQCLLMFIYVGHLKKLMVVPFSYQQYKGRELLPRQESCFREREKDINDLTKS
jgi:hypothetical protein